MFGHKRCPKCKTVKLEKDFHKDASQFDGYCSYCKVCKAMAARYRYQRNPEVLILAAKKYLASLTPEQRREHNYKRKLKRVLG